MPSWFKLGNVRVIDLKRFGEDTLTMTGIWMLIVVSLFSSVYSQSGAYVACIDANNNEDLTDDEILPFRGIFWHKEGEKNFCL